MTVYMNTDKEAERESEHIYSIMCTLMHWYLFTHHGLLPYYPP